MKNLVLITSIIDTPNIPLSYVNTRSIFTSDERFEQTKKTIESVKEKIPNAKIIIVECSELTKQQNDYFLINCDYFLNLINNQTYKNSIHSVSKSLGEGTMTIVAMDFIKSNNIEFENFFKISGRYWLSDKFDYKNFDNTNCIIHYIKLYANNPSTRLYKLNQINFNKFFDFLISHVNLMIQCIGYEELFSIFLKLNCENEIISLDPIGICGNISCYKEFINE